MQLKAINCQKRKRKHDPIIFYLPETHFTSKDLSGKWKDGKRHSMPITNQKRDGVATLISAKTD